MLQGLIKNREEITKIYLTYYNSLRAQDSWQARYHIFIITILKEFIEINVNTDMIIKNNKLVELNISIATVFLNT